MGRRAPQRRALGHGDRGRRRAPSPTRRRPRRRRATARRRAPPGRARRAPACPAARRAAAPSPVGVLPPASSIRSRVAPRAIPSVTEAIDSASRPNAGNAWSGVAVSGACVISDAERLARRACAVERDVVAAGPAQPGDVPRVVDRERVAREEHEAHVGRAGGRAHDVVALADEAADHQPVGVRAAAGERPATGDDELVAVGNRAAARREDAGRDRAVAVDLARDVRLEIRGQHAAGAAHGDDPGRGRVPLRERAHRVEEDLRLELEARRALRARVRGRGRLRAARPRPARRGAARPHPTRRARRRVA